MNRRRATRELVAVMYDLLLEHRPQTVRQVFYRLVARQLIANVLSEYKRVSRVLSDARYDGEIPWEWVEDRIRKPRHIPQWEDPAHFAVSIAGQYRRNVWLTQPRLVECCLEKDALSGIFEDELEPYGMTLNVGRGFDSTSSVKDIADRFAEARARTGAWGAIPFFGDFDGSGLEMEESLRGRLARHGCGAELVRVGLTEDDMRSGRFPVDFAKPKDSRTAKHVARYGQQGCVELDALPVEELRARIRAAVEERMDMSALDAVRELEEEERERLYEALEDWAA